MATPRVTEVSNIPGAVQKALESFNAKYPNVTGAMSSAPPGLVFTGQATMATVGAVVTVPAQAMESLG